MTEPQGSLPPRLELAFLLSVVGMAVCLIVLPILLELCRTAIPFWTFLLLSTVPIQLTNIFASIIPARKYCPKKPLAPLLDLVSPDRSQWPLVLGGTGAVYLLLALVTGMTGVVLEKFHLPSPEQPILELLRQGSPGHLFLLIPVMLVLAPLGEELCFRQVIFKKLEFHIGPVPALLMTSFLFAAVHFNLRVFPSLFLLGLWLAMLYRRTGSLLSAVVAHSLFNAISILLLVFLSFVNQ